MTYGQTTNLALEKRIDTLSEKQKKMEKQLCELKEEKNCTGCGQSNPVKSCEKNEMQDIDIDFECRSAVLLPKKMKEGAFYRIRVKNINTNIYNIIINSKDTITTKPLTDTPLFKDINLDALIKLTAGFIESVNANEKQIAVSDTTYKVATTPTKKIEIPVDYKKKLEGRLYTIKSSLKISLKALIEFKKSYDVEKMKLYVYRLKKQSIKNDFIPDGFDYKEALKTFESLRADLIKQAEDLDSIDTNFKKDISNQKYKDVLKIESIKESIASINGTIAEINTKIIAFQEQTNAENVEKLLRSILYYTNCRDYTSLPIQFNKEQAIVSIQFVPKDSTSGLQTEKMAPFYFPVKTSEYWSIGSSLYYAFNLANQSFSTIATSDASNNKTYKVVQEQDLKSEFGIATTLRYGGKFNEYLGAHLSFGPGVSIEKNTKPRLLFGGGFSYGKKHSLALDLGFIAGYVDVKTNSLDLSITYPEAPQTSITKIDFGGYLSIGYLYKF